MKQGVIVDPQVRRRPERGPWRAVCLGVVLASLLLLPRCSERKAPAIVPEAVPVTVATVIQKTVPVQVRAIGNVEAYSTVSVKSQVEGTLERVHFIEGQDVKKGDLLFTIDSRLFEAALQQAEANLAKDLAQEKNAKAQADRYAKLFEQGIVSKELNDQMRTSADALEAAVRADKAAVEDAKIQLGYCTIRSPLDGRTGSLLVHQGNLVKANDVVLVVINQVTPINVSFSVPEQFLPQIRKYRAGGRLQVDALIPDDERGPAKGVLAFVNNAVDHTTGTIQLKATFANQDRRLWPGQFVNVVLTLAEQPNARVVPSRAVQTGQGGQYVFVVKPDLTVESRLVVVGRTLEGETVVEEGLEPDERVVTDGQLRLVPGAKVEVKRGAEGGQEKRS